MCDNSLMQVIVEGLAAEYQVSGQGPTLLLLHGWQDSLKTFDGLCHELGADYQVVRVDFPGFGGSEQPKEAWDVGKYAQWLASFLKKIECQPEVVVGHSMGGRIAIKGIAEGVLKPEKLVLIASGGVKSQLGLKGKVAKTLALGSKLGRLPKADRWKARARQILYGWLKSDYYAAGPLQETFKLIVAEDLLSTAAQIDRPTLIIWGANDTVVPPSDGEQFTKAIIGSKLEVIEGAGHFVHQEKSAEVARLIKDFI